MSLTLTPELEQEYQALYDSMQPAQARHAAIDALANRVISNRGRYEVVAQRVGVPWQLVAVIHNMEASQNFTRHLHNGDKLTARTTHVPAGRPVAGHPPFTWEESAIDALKLKDLDEWRDWSIAGVLFKLEQYNGWGYRNHHADVKSPYLWSFCQHYTSGKYVSDGKWSQTAVSDQCGAAVLLHRLAKLGHPIPPPPPREHLPGEFSGVRYAPTQHDATAERLQAWLNTHPGVSLVVDGKAGQRTSNAVRFVTGEYLAGDPRA
jgi:lysozyme family protein